MAILEAFSIRSKMSSSNRYDRQILLPAIGVEGQNRLERSRVLVAGLGGLGSPSAYYLAAAGVGLLGLADDDAVAENNLHRQILHTEESIGRRKVESAVERLEAMNNTIHYHLHPEGIRPENAVELLRQYDLVLDGTDRIHSRYLINDAAWLAGVPVVSAGALGFGGQVMILDPHHGGPCFRCLFPQPPNSEEMPNCARAGVLGAVCGVIGTWQALAALHYLLGTGEIATDRCWAIDGWALKIRQVSIKRDPACALCGPSPTIRAIDPRTYLPAGCFMDQTTNDKRMDSDNWPMEMTVSEVLAWPGEKPPLYYLDVREPDEVAICRLAGSHHIPLRNVADRLSELPTDRPILTICHHGMRSLRVAHFLREKGFPVTASLRGGIDAWARQADPAMNRY